MFERILSAFVQKYLGQYIEGLETRNFRLAFWRGSVTVTELNVRIDEINHQLENSSIPLRLKEGFIGKLEMKIPWRDMKNQPIVIKFEDVFLLCTPLMKVPSPSQPKDEYEIDTSPRNPQDPNLLEALFTKVLENIQVTISNLNIRYEDEGKLKEHPKVVGGINLEYLSIISTDPKFRSMFAPEPHSIIYKLLSLKNLSVYLVPDGDLLSYDSVKDFGKKMMEDFNAIEDHFFLLKPVCLDVRVTLSKRAPKRKSPKIMIEILINRLLFGLEEKQLQKIRIMLSFFSVMTKRLKHRDIRPKVSPIEDPAAWWVYAAKASRKERGIRSFEMTAKYVEQRRRNRKQYVQLYKKDLQGKLTNEESRTLNHLDSTLSDSNIRLFRTIATEELKKEGQDVKRLSSKRFQKKKSWLEWLFGWKKATSTSELFTLTEEEMKQLYSTVEYDEVEFFSQTTDPQALNMVVEVTVSGKAQLLSEKEILAELQISKFILEIYRYPKTITFSASLLKFELNDYFTSNSKYVTLVEPIKESEAYFFDLLVEIDPFSREDLDYYISLNANPLKLIYNQNFINRLVSFFSSDQQTQVSTNLATNTEQMALALESNPSILIEAHLSAPQIFIPEDFTHKGGLMLFADLGKVSISTIPAESKEEKIYKSFQIEMDDLCLRAITRGGKREKAWEVVEKFSLSIGLEISTISSADRPRIRVSGDLPSLNVFLSLRTINMFQRILFSITSKSLAKKETPQEKNQYHGKQEKDDSKKNLPRYNKYFLEASFSVDKISVNIQRVSSPQPLVLLELNDIYLHLVEKRYTVDGDLILQQLKMVDKLQKNGREFEYLVISERDRRTPYIRIHYSHSSDEEFSNFRDCIGSLMSVEFSSVMCTFNRATIVELIQFGEEIMKERTQQQKTKKKLQKAQQKRKHRGECNLFKVGVSCQAVNIVMNRDGEKLCFISISSSLFDFSMSTMKSSIQSKIGKIRIVNSIEQLDFLNTEGKNSIQVYYSDSSSKEREPILYAKVNSMNFLYQDKFIYDLKKYFHELNRMKNHIDCIVNPDSDKSKSQEGSFPSKAKTTWVRLRVLIANPKLQLSSKDSVGSIVTDLGEIYLQNKIVQKEDESISFGKIDISVRKMNVQSNLPSDAVAKNKIINNANFSIRIYRALDPEICPTIRAKVHVPDVVVSLNLEQFFLLMDILKQRALTGPYVPPKSKDDTISMTFDLRFDRASFHLLKLDIGKKGIHFTSAPKADEPVSLDNRWLELDVIGRGIQLFLNSNETHMYFNVYRINGNTRIGMYTSEKVSICTSPQWKPFFLPISELINHEKLIFECTLCNKQGVPTIVGSFETNMFQVLTKKTFALINKKFKKKFKDQYNHSGLFEISARLSSDESFPKGYKVSEEDEFRTIKQYPKFTKFISATARNVDSKLVFFKDNSYFVYDNNPH